MSATTLPRLAAAPIIFPGAAGLAALRRSPTTGRRAPFASRGENRGGAAVNDDVEIPEYLPPSDREYFLGLSAEDRAGFILLLDSQRRPDPDRRFFPNPQQRGASSDFPGFALPEYPAGTGAQRRRLIARLWGDGAAGQRRSAELEELIHRTACSFLDVARQIAASRRLGDEIEYLEEVAAGAKELARRLARLSEQTRTTLMLEAIGRGVELLSILQREPRSASAQVFSLVSSPGDALPALATAATKTIAHLDNGDGGRGWQNIAQREHGDPRDILVSAAVNLIKIMTTEKPSTTQDGLLETTAGELFSYAVGVDASTCLEHLNLFHVMKRLLHRRRLSEVERDLQELAHDESRLRELMRLPEDAGLRAKQEQALELLIDRQRKLSAEIERMAAKRPPKVKNLTRVKGKRPAR